MDPYDLAKTYMSYRSSIEATHDLPVQLLKNGLVDKLRDDELVINRNVEVITTYLKTMGYKLEQEREIKELIFDYMDNDLHERELPNGEKVLVTDSKYIEMLIMDKRLEGLTREDLMAAIEAMDKMEAAKAAEAEAAKERELEEIRKIIVQKIPHLNEGELLFEPEEAAEIIKTEYFKWQAN